MLDNQKETIVAVNQEREMLLTTVEKQTKQLQELKKERNHFKERYNRVMNTKIMKWTGKYWKLRKKNAIKEQVNQLNSTISYFQNKLIAELHPVLLHNKVLQKSENWWFVSDEGLRCYNSEDNLCFVNRVDTANYTSFKENNVAFTRMPTKHIDVLPEENLFIHFEAEFLDELKAKIAIVEYSGHKKIATTMVNVNEEAQITLNKSTKYIRVALKMTGRGMAIFKKNDP
ncbi:hypothetical protein [Listeria fleischmannii]|uniref:Uncharacterized protein n=1 Tax=Listeria fleischmannii FSL S10-1203 TaxID=1265822 RepID=W7DWG8_9LIST|nr:hypothetical protein [Listeria fleischmannii]EUJ52462.1 hypothetical protein MCOL2_13614 [Listeria fleischmannii FSL S10-1203]